MCALSLGGEGELPLCPAFFLPRLEDEDGVDISSCREKGDSGVPNMRGDCVLSKVPCGPFLPWLADSTPPIWIMLSQKEAGEGVRACFFSLAFLPRFLVVARDPPSMCCWCWRP